MLSAQEGMGWVGLSSLIARAGAIDRVTILAPGEEVRAEADRSADALGTFGDVLVGTGLKAVRWLAPAVMQPGAHMEVVRASEAQWLLGAAASAAGITVATRGGWVPAPARATLLTSHADGVFSDVSTTLTDLVERHGVSGHEWSVRRAVLEALPSWARDRAVVDDIGNVMVAAGPEGVATVFMAHLDEVGYTIASIAGDGTVALTAQGGVTASAWEGQTALVHFDPDGAPSTTTGTGSDTHPRWKAGSLVATAPPPLRGVFRIRSTADQKNPSVAHAWFGRTRYTARALDDRAGTTALLRAINRIDPATLPGRVIFAWSVHEEGGLNGARAFGNRAGAGLRRVYSIDTFVSSDTPLETPHFAYAPLGAGLVLRGLDDGSLAPAAERERILRIARAAGDPDPGGHHAGRHRRLGDLAVGPA